VTPRASPDGHYGILGHLQGAEHQQEAPPTQDLALLAEKAGNHATQSCLAQQHYLHRRQEQLSGAGQ